MTKAPRRIVCLFLAVCLALGLAACASPEVRESYRLGSEAMKEGRYADAAACFGPLEGYRKSEQRLTEIYDRAMALYSEGSFREAAGLFEALAPYAVGDAALYAPLSAARACMGELDAAGAFAALETAEPSAPEVMALLDELEQMCFAGTVLIRPEYVAQELTGGRVVPEISSVSAERHMDEIVYAMSRSATDSVYRQYRDYCRSAFPDSFTDGSESYFTFQIDGTTYYVCNYYALYGGLLIKIPRY